MTDIVIIGGCGHVGLPLGLAFAQAGKRVLALDLDASKVEQTNQGVMPFTDAGADEVLREVRRQGTFEATTAPDVIGSADIVITVIGTPLDEHLNPRLEVYRELLDKDSSFLRDGQLLVLRSTVYPGTTDHVAHAAGERGPGGRRRLLPRARGRRRGPARRSTSLPQIVSGTTPRALERAADAVPRPDARRDRAADRSRPS